MELGVPYRVLPNILQQRQLTSYVWLIIKWLWASCYFLHRHLITMIILTLINNECIALWGCSVINVTCYLDVLNKWHCSNWDSFLTPRCPRMEGFRCNILYIKYDLDSTHIGLFVGGLYNLVILNVDSKANPHPKVPSITRQYLSCGGRHTSYGAFLSILSIFFQDIFIAIFCRVPGVWK